MTLKILVIDDNVDKAREVVRGLSSLEGMAASDFELAPTAIVAKRLLQSTSFDLVIVDIALPLRLDQDPDPAGGIKLLDEVLSRPRYIVPRHIVGLTAFADVYKDAAARFGNELWSIVFYDPSSEEWLDQLRAKARHIIVSEKTWEGSTGYAIDLCIVAALQDPELDAMLRLSWDWEECQVARDSTTYFGGTYTASDGSRRRVMAARAASMGMPAAAILATKMCMHFRPRCLVMPGLCAGNRDEVELGDVIVANPSWDYGSGKHNHGSGFAPAPQQASISSRIRQLAERLQGNPSQLDAVRRSFAGQTPTTALTLHIGPMASGSAVLADQQRFDEVKGQHRKLIGVDMEAYAVMAAAAEMPEPRPEVIVVKGVSDHANAEKNDRFRHYAAFASAQVVRILAQELDL